MILEKDKYRDGTVRTSIYLFLKKYLTPKITIKNSLYSWLINIKNFLSAHYFHNSTITHRNGSCPAQKTNRISVNGSPNLKTRG